MRSRIVATAAALTLLTVAAPAHADRIDPAPLRQALDEVVARGGGSTVLQVMDGRRRTTVKSGVGDLATGEAIPAGSSFRVGSISKPFIAVTILQLVGEGRIDLDATVDRYLPNLGLTYADTITVRSLLDMTAGVPDNPPAYWALYPNELDWFATGRFRTWTGQEVVNLVKSLPRTSGYVYSNTNYVILGMLIEQVTGRTYQSEVERRIAGPLGLRDTYFPVTDTVIRGPHARQYAVSDRNPGTPYDISEQNVTYAHAAGALVSTPEDLITFNRALLKGKLLDRRLLREMMTFVPIAGDPAKAMGLGYLSWKLPCGRTVYGFIGRILGSAATVLGTVEGKDRQLGWGFAAHDSSMRPAQNERMRDLIHTTFCG